jgi:hypothetical protein
MILSLHTIAETAVFVNNFHFLLDLLRMMDYSIHRLALGGGGE